MSILQWIFRVLDESAFRRTVRLGEVTRQARKATWETLDDRIKSYSVLFDLSDLSKAYNAKQDVGDAKYLAEWEVAEIFFENGPYYVLYAKIVADKMRLKPIVRQPPYGNLDMTKVNEVADLVIENESFPKKLALNKLGEAELDYRLLEYRYMGVL